MRPVPALLALVTALLLATACSGGGAAPPAAAPPSAGASTAAASPTRPCTPDDVTVTGAPGSKPTITVPDGCTPPTTLEKKDLVVGTGKPVVEGSTVDTQYDLVTWSDRQELDASWNRGQTFPLENVGHADVIQGWNEGVIGMKQGGRRLLIIPPDLAYGQGGNGVAPNETLVFVVDAVTVR